LLKKQLEKLEAELAKVEPEKPQEDRTGLLKNQLNRQEMKLQEMQLMNREYNAMVRLFPPSSVREKQLSDEKAELIKVRAEQQ